MNIKIKKLYPDTKLPTYAHLGDVGLDMYSREDVTVNPGEHVRLYNGFALEFEAGYGAFVKDKGSISKVGLHVMGGVFDAGFRGEYNVHLVNLSNQAYEIKKGDKIAQLVILPVEIAVLEPVEELSKSARAEGAFGSTGR